MELGNTAMAAGISYAIKFKKIKKLYACLLVMEPLDKVYFTRHCSIISNKNFQF